MSFLVDYHFIQGCWPSVNFLPSAAGILVVYSGDTDAPRSPLAVRSTADIRAAALEVKNENPHRDDRLWFGFKREAPTGHTGASARPA